MIGAKDAAHVAFNDAVCETADNVLSLKRH